MTEYTYSFHCPSCGGSWTYEQFAAITKNVFMSWDGTDACPLCDRIFQWDKPGTLKDRAWYEGKPSVNYTRTCGWCSKRIDSRRRQFCNDQCYHKFYYRKIHPVAKYKTPRVK